MRRSRLSVWPAAALAAALMLTGQTPGRGQTVVAFAPASASGPALQPSMTGGPPGNAVLNDAGPLKGSPSSGGPLVSGGQLNVGPPSVGTLNAVPPNVGNEIVSPGPAPGPVYTQSGPTWKEQEPGWVGEEDEEPEEVRPSLWKRWFGGSERWSSNGRSRDFGHPLGADTWLTRPYSIGLFSGGFFPGNPIPTRVNGTNSYLVGGRLGWDLENFWGVEGRFAYSAYGLQAPATGLPLRKLTTFLLDTDFLYYPFGDTQWRPFFLLGFGFADFRFTDDNNLQVHQTALDIPFGIGLKYRHNEQWAFRVDLTDNLSFATGQNIATMNNISFTGGIEARWGMGARKSYWPWNPSRSYR